MANNKPSDNKKRNVTGSYPGVTGSYKPTSAYPKPEKSVTSRSESVKQQAKPVKKQGFDFKLWFSKDNVQVFIKQLRFYGIIVLISLLLTVGIVTVANDIFAFIKPDESIVVTIADGGGTASIAKELKKSGVIEHPLVFRLYSKLKKADDKFRHGTYTLNSNLGYDQIISQLKKASSESETFTLSIPVGSTQDDIATLLTSGNGATSIDVEYAFNEYEYEDFSWVAELPDRRCRLEGYLPAGDYEFYVGESAVSMVRKMLTRFTETVLTEENVKLIADSGMSTDDVITLASLVQAECDRTSMYKGAASVLLNRLKSGTDNFLKLTAPINYVLPAAKAQLEETDKKTDSEYNTYMYSGLPTGPICNPSIEAVAAVLSPESSEYMYFISDGDKSYFSTTVQEHRSKLKNASDSAKGTDTISK